MTELERQYRFLNESAGVLDLSTRGRLCVIGADRLRFLNGQVTNNVKDLAAGQGCYAALVNAKGKLQSDLNIHCLAEELLLDFEPGLTTTVAERLEKYIIADDVQVIDVSSNYGMLAVIGPRSGDVATAAGLAVRGAPFQSTGTKVGSNDVYCINHPRGAMSALDVFLPANEREGWLQKLAEVARGFGGGAVSMEALEVMRIEAGIPRFGVDMDESNLAPEALDTRAISYAKGCYIGQEVISRIRAFGQVAKRLKGLRLPRDLPILPKRGDKLFREGREAGYITSAVRSLKFGENIALGYVRREHNAIGSELEAVLGGARTSARVCDLPFGPESFK